MPFDPIGKVGQAGEHWLRNENEKAWKEIVDAYGKQPSGYENAFNHVHGAALVRRMVGFDMPARALGAVKEKVQWPAAQKYPGERVDTYGDLWNDEIGIQIGKLNPAIDIRAAAFDAVRNGTATVNKFRPGDDRRIPAEVVTMSLEDMQSQAPREARRYLKEQEQVRRPRPPAQGPIAVPLPLGRPAAEPSLPLARLVYQDRTSAPRTNRTR